MFTKTFSLVFSWLLIGALAASPILARTNATTVAKQPTQEAEYKKRIVEWGTNKSVSIKLKSGEKIKGRVAEINDENFTVQFVENGKVVNRDFRYNELQSISSKANTNGAKVAAWIALGAAAGIGVLVLIGLSLSD